ncbi:hypothetical protein F5Y15DRAFT_284101 [Xylariaceae sp. FL0016]|nr:hypothetical protein F5Y15DRAFT_284101 [Xylariaceae sp. FL0016]
MWRMPPATGLENSRAFHWPLASALPILSIFLIVKSEPENLDFDSTPEHPANISSHPLVPPVTVIIHHIDFESLTSHKSHKSHKSLKMPRQSRSAGRAPARPTVPAKAATPQQQRPATTYAPAQGASQPHPPAQAAAPQASQGPGLFGQMASTAAGVAVGSSIGHAIGGLFSGGGSSEAAAPQQTNAAPMQHEQNQYSNNNCAGAAESFTKCMDDHSGNMSICNWYLEQLKACQAAAKQY